MQEQTSRIVKGLMNDFPGVDEETARQAKDDAIETVEEQQDKSEDEFDEQDWGLVVTIAKNDLESQGFERQEMVEDFLSADDIGDWLEDVSRENVNERIQDIIDDL